MAMRFVPTYLDGSNEVRFVPLDPAAGALPGFTHRVIINRCSVGFLSERFKPSAKVAAFWLGEHGHKAGVKATA